MSFSRVLQLFTLTLPMSLFFGGNEVIAGFSPNLNSEFNHDFKIIRQGSLLLATADDCSFLERQGEALRTWAERISGSRLNAPMVQLDGTRCVLEIQDIVPTFVMDYGRMKIPNDGPNCWSAGLLSLGVIEVPRHVTRVEFKMWLESPFCRPLKAEEVPEPGDIVAVRQDTSFFVSGSSNEMHAMVYLSEDLVFAKNGLYSSAPYELQPFGNNEYVQSLRRHPECLNLRAKSNPPKQCGEFINYYRCDSQRIKNAVVSARSDLANVNQFSSKTAALQKELDPRCMNENGLPSSGQIERMAKEIESLEKEIAELLPDPLLDEKPSKLSRREQWFLKSLDHELNSLSHEVDYLKRGGAPEFIPVTEIAE